MAKIPTYESRVPMTTEVPAELTFPWQAGIVGEAMAKAGEQMTKLSEAIYKIRSDQQEAQAVLEGKKRMDEVVLNATSNPNIIFDENVANKDLLKAREEALKLAPTPEAKANASARLDMEIVDYQLKLKTFSYKKLTEQRRIQLGNFKAKALDSWAAETKSGLKRKILGELGHEFQKAYDTGVISQADFTKNMEMIREELPEKQAEWDILNAPEMALAGLQKGDRGPYKGVSLDKRTELIGKAENRIEKLGKQERETIAFATNQRESELIDLKIANNLSVQQVKNERNAKKITAHFADSMIRALESPRTVGASTSAKTLNKIAEDILNPEKNPEEIELVMLQKNSIGELNDKDYQTLHIFNKNVTGNEIDKILNIKSFLMRLISRDWSEEKGLSREEVKSRMFKQYMEKINKGEDPGKAVSEIINLWLDNYLAEQAKMPNRRYSINPQTKR